ncbi:gag-pol polyprotein [Hordeum vulgare]|nr:gag-pol polyprotein [Hordeum vulgare]
MAKIKANFGALKVHQELKAKAIRPRARFTMTKLQDGESEDGTTNMSKPDKIHDDLPKFHFTAIPHTMDLFEDDKMTTTMGPLKEHALEASDKVASKDDASIFGGESEMIKYGIFP